MQGQTAPSQEHQWHEKYKVHLPGVTDGPKANFTVYDFSTVTSVPPQDWAAAQAAEAAELAARPEALAAAERSKYLRLNVPMITLRDGTKMPAVGLGTWKAEKGEVASAVHLALQAGYRHIDCAAVYQNEDEVGKSLDYVLSKGLVPREEFYVCSKVWNSDHAAERVRAACLKSLKSLKLSYLDLYLIHWPVTGNVGPTVTPSIKETWQAMEGLVKEGLVRSIGVSNFSAIKLADILTYANIKPAVCQVEVHPYHRNDALIDWCRHHDIHVTAFSPLGSPDSESIFPRKIPAVLLKDPVVHRIAESVGKDTGQVLIRWALQHGTSVIPKSVNPRRIKTNIEVLDWELDSESYKKLSLLKFQQRMVNGAMWLNPKGPYRTMEALWDEAEVDPDTSELDTGDTPLTPAAAAPVVSAPSVEVVKGAGDIRVVLNNGCKMPLLGLGTWKSAPGQVAVAVEAAIRMGYRHIDCAEVYQNEHEVGQALKAVLDAGVVQREDLWITSKVWNTNHAAPAVHRALQRTLRNLNLQYLDLYLIHWPATGNKGPSVDPPIKETWQAMEGLVKDGLIRSIGVSNFSAKKLAEILKYATIKPAVCQVEAHPYHINEALLAWCQQHGIHVTAYSPLGSPDSAALFSRQAPSLMEDSTVASIAGRLGKSPAQVLVRWALQRGTSVLPKSVNPARIRSNAEVWDWELSGADVAALSMLGYQQRMVDAAFLLSPKGPYKTMQDLWDDDNEPLMNEASPAQPEARPDRRKPSGSYPLNILVSEDAETDTSSIEGHQLKAEPGFSGASELPPTTAAPLKEGEKKSSGLVGKMKGWFS